MKYGIARCQEPATILLPRQAKRFCKLFDAVVIFANERLGVGKRLIASSGGIDDGEVAKVCDALWSGTADRPVIGESIAENPCGFLRTDLREIVQWEHAINGGFFIMRHGEDMFFLYGSHAVAARGIAREIDTMITYVPTVARTTPLPFERLIVYTMSLSKHPLDFGDVLCGTLDAELEKMISDRKTIRSAKQLVDRAPQLEEERISHAAAEFVRETFSGLDWDVELARAREVDGIIHFFDLALDLCGVAYLSELMHEYAESYGESELVDIEELGYFLLAGVIGELIILDDEPVLMGMRVISTLRHFPREEQIEDETRYYLVEQGKKPIQPVLDELEDTGEAVEWMIDLPEAQALTAHLDEHVPEEDEHFWAEDTVYMLVDGPYC